MSLNIKINDRYTVTSDSRQFILNKTEAKGAKYKEPGSMSIKPVGYFHSLDGLTKQLIQIGLKESDAKSLKQCQEIIESAAAQCLEAFAVKGSHLIDGPQDA